MAPRTWPTRPNFVDDSERIVWDALRSALRDIDVLLHGVRITDPVDGDVEIDLIVLMPDCGAAVIEVKGGHLRFADGGVIQSGADGSQTIDPAAQAARGARAFARYVERQPDWSRGRLRWIWQVAMPYTDAPNGLGPTLPVEALIGEPHLADAAGLVYDRLRHRHREAPLPAAGWVDAVLEYMVGAHDPDAAHIVVPALARERAQHVAQLTLRQSTLLDITRNVHRLEVSGPAGTGKSWLAASLAQRWARETQRVAFVTYTRGVVEWLRTLVADAPPAFLGTFFQLGFTWGVQAEGSSDAQFWEGAGVQRMLEAARALPDAQRFTALIVDEGQDFSDDWWPVLLAAATVDARIAVFRDDEQSVFTGRLGRPDLDLVPLTLTENLRNGTQIVDAFRPLVHAKVTAHAGPAYPVEYRDTTPPEVIDGADDAVAELVEQRGWLPEHVALLTTRHRHPVQVERDHDRAAYWEGLHDPEVFYGTVAGFKGLERPAIVVAVNGFHEGVDPRGVLYTAMSRARDLLVVVGSIDEIRAAAGDKLARRLLRGRTAPSSG